LYFQPTDIAAIYVDVSHCALSLHSCRAATRRFDAAVPLYRRALR